MLNSLEFVKVASVSEILKRSFNTKIFSLNRIKYEELWEDALKYIKGVYNSKNEEFNSSSPFAQLLSVILHLGRMIIYYIEDAINGTNIKTAWRPDQIRGLATLTEPLSESLTTVLLMTLTIVLSIFRTSSR